MDLENEKLRIDIYCDIGGRKEIQIIEIKNQKQAVFYPLGSNNELDKDLQAQIHKELKSFIKKKNIDFFDKRSEYFRPKELPEDVTKKYRKLDDYLWFMMFKLVYYYIAHIADTKKFTSALFMHLNRKDPLLYNLWMFEDYWERVRQGTQSLKALRSKYD